MARRSKRAHGTHSRYSSGCRCEPCREAHRIYGRENYRQRMRELRPGWTPERKRARHGTNSGYSTGCRCDLCREARRRYRIVQIRREGFRARVPTPPLRAQVACLIAFGIPRTRIAGATGLSYKTLELARETVNRKTADAISGVHWSLWRRHGPFRAHCKCEIPQQVLEWLESEVSA